jgi:hypothetical protein
MMRFQIRPVSLACALLALGLASPAAAQFDPAFNHLKCYRIKPKPGTSGSIVKTLIAENQFGRERIVKLVPFFLCAPTKKTCCSNPPNVPGCNPVPCQPDPLPTQPAPVDHFKCYKIGVKPCDQASAACTTLAKAAKAIPATLINQFGTEEVLIGPAKMLCTPVLKILQTPTTSTTVTTTTTVQQTTTTSTLPCRDISQPGQALMCAGSCPPGLGLECVFVPGIGCTCELGCALQGPAPQTCNMQFCPKAGQQCIPNAVNPCGCCYPPGAGPCTANADCCSGNCDVANQVCL